MPRILWAIDPGAARNGLSVWDLDTGEHYGKYVLSYDEMLGMLDRLSDDSGVEEIVVEDYIIAPGKNSGSRGETIKVIANVEAANRRLGRRILLTKQRPGILRTTAKMAGVRLGTGHIPDDVSAYLHGWHRMRQLGKVKSALELKRGV